MVEVEAMIALMRAYPDKPIRFSAGMLSADIPGFDDRMNAVYSAGWKVSLERGTVHLRQRDKVLALTGAEVVT